MNQRKKTMRPLDARPSIAEAAAERIREAILSGSYAQGQRLSDLHIAEELETSRGPIREALKLLQAEGLVVQKQPHRGVYVTSVSADDMRETCELRVALESHAVRLLASRSRDTNLSALYGIVDKMDKAAAEGNQLRVSQLDMDFHEALCRLGGGQRLYEVFEREILNTLGLFGLDAIAYRPESDMGREFRPLLESIQAGDGERAARFIEEHVRRACSLLGDTLEPAHESPTGDA